MTIDKLARITQDQFSQIDERFNGVDSVLMELKVGQKQILDVLLEIPSKKAFERLDDKVQGFNVRLVSIERKVK